MALSAGEKLGPYQILQKIGAGGMGEVWRARDERLGRDVAIKVSAEQFNERFAREARLIASLNHQNICSLFDVGPNFLVMELVDGPTLAERIAEGPLPVDEALGIADQIAEALQAAHDSGVVHRDLKPGNIKIRPDGTVKVLDFGLAKMGVSDASRASLNESPTISVMATGAGIILGTPAYMSPEQARGKAVDKRADIWAFGAVLYEMLTGKQLFSGEDVSEVLASVIMKQPDFDAVPPRVRRVLSRCLEKDPRKRLRDISGVALLLDQTTTPEQPSVHAAPSRLTSRWPWVAALSAALLAVTFGVLWYTSARTETPLRPLVNLNVDLGRSVVFSASGISGSSIILSSDGTRLAYISQSRLFVRDLNQPTAKEIPVTSGAYGAFFSPDAKWLGFFAGAKLKKVSVEGGAVVDLADAGTSRGATWAEDGTIIVSLSSTGPLSQLSSNGGPAKPLTKFAEGEATHRWPQMVPGGKAFVYTANSVVTGFDNATIKLQSLVDGTTKTLHQGGTGGRVVKTLSGRHYLLYLSRGTLFAEPFDVDRLEVTGQAVPMVDGIGTSASGVTELDIANNGTLAYRVVAGGLMTVQWLDSTGKLEPLLSKPASYGRPSVSPDGEKLALELSDSGSTDIYVYEQRPDRLSRLTFTKTNAGPIWSPDGSYIVYQDPGGMSWIRSDGGKPQPLIRGKGLQFPWSFIPDGKRLAYMEVGKGGYDIWTVHLGGDAVSGLRPGTPEPFLLGDGDERYPEFSPDGRWLSYSSSESGNFEVYVRAFPDTGAKWQVSNNSGAYPNWSRSLNELVFETLDAQIMSARYTVKNGSIILEKPQPWSPKPVFNTVNSVKNFDLAPDGKRIAVFMPLETPEEAVAQSHVTFLLNFFDELDRRVPLGQP